MKSIPNAVYESLSAEQRVKTAIEAVGRDDHEELHKLKTTCPKLSYLMTDPEYSDRMKRLSHIAITTECDLRGAALDFFVYSKSKEFVHVMRAESAMEEIASIRKAFLMLADYLGVDSEVFQKAYLNNHPAVDVAAQVGDYDPDDTATEAYYKLLVGYLEA